MNFSTIGRAILMTIASTTDMYKDYPSENWWYWLCEIGPYSYILTGNVIVIFLVNLLLRINARRALTDSWAGPIGQLIRIIAPLSMFANLLGFVIVGLLNHSNNAQVDDSDIL